MDITLTNARQRIAAVLNCLPCNHHCPTYLDVLLASASSATLALVRVQVTEQILIFHVNRTAKLVNPNSGAGEHNISVSDFEVQGAGMC